VTDVTASANWYSETFGLQVVLIEEEEAEIVGTVLSLGEGAPSLGLHHDPTRAAALAGFRVIAIAVDSLQTLAEWDTWLKKIEAVHSPAVNGAIGWYIDIPDPDGLILQLHTPEQPSVEES
jgi:predicted enzyme related to lactoylglutathione lyase